MVLRLILTSICFFHKYFLFLKIFLNPVCLKYSPLLFSDSSIIAPWMGWKARTIFSKGSWIYTRKMAGQYYFQTTPICFSTFWVWTSIVHRAESGTSRGFISCDSSTYYDLCTYLFLFFFYSALYFIQGSWAERRMGEENPKSTAFIFA